MKKIIILIVAVFSFCGGLRCQPVVTKPNIIFIMADDLGYGDVSCYNSQSRIQTPNIDRLATQGMLFSDAHSPSAVCTPTRYGLLSGRYAWRGQLKRGVIEGSHLPLLENGRQTIASVLQQQGYKTAVIGKWHLGLTYQNEQGQPSRTLEGKYQKGDVDFTRPILNGPNQHGFDYSYITPGCPSDDEFNFFVENNVIQGEVRYNEEMEWLEAENWQHEKVDTLITGKTIRFIRKHVASKPDQPFFAYVALSVPHIPWLPPQFVKSKSAAGPRGDQVVLADWCLQQIDNLLSELNIAGNTLLIFTSDNGPREGINGHSSAGPLRGLKGEVWEGGHRVPFIARWPGKIQANTISDELICLSDLMATFSALTGYNMPQDCGEDSFNFLPVLMAKEYTKPVRKGIINHSGQGVFCIREDGWKLIVDCDNDGYLTEIGPGEKGQLFNLSEDPYETNNLIDARPDRVKELQNKLDMYMAQGYSRSR